MDSLYFRESLWRSLQDFPDALGESADIGLRNLGKMGIFYRMHIPLS